MAQTSHILAYLSICFACFVVLFEVFVGISNCKQHMFKNDSSMYKTIWNLPRSRDKNQSLHRDGKIDDLIIGIEESLETNIIESIIEVAEKMKIEHSFGPSLSVDEDKKTRELEIDEDTTQIFLTGPYEYELPTGETRNIFPSCSGGPDLDNGRVAQRDRQYSFFVKKGDPTKLMLFFDGGGTCYDAQTCLASAIVGKPTYRRAVGKMNESKYGVFDDNAAGNPYRHYTKIFIPYCTGDLFWGSRDTEYQLGPIYGSTSWTIHHRGTDNFMSVFHWLRSKREGFDIDLSKVRDVSLLGASAGGYGVIMAFSYVAELVPNAQLDMISDSAVGVMSDSFFRKAVYDKDDPDSASWGVKDVLPTWAGLDESLLYQFSDQINNLPPNIYYLLSRYRPWSNLAIVTSNVDFVQIGFYKRMLSIDKQPPPDEVIVLEWYDSMKKIINKVEELVPRNYRSHIENGNYHTVLMDQRYYTSGLSGVPVSYWNQCMIAKNNCWIDIEMSASFPFYSKGKTN